MGNYSPPRCPSSHVGYAIPGPRHSLGSHEKEAHGGGGEWRLGVRDESSNVEAVGARRAAPAEPAGRVPLLLLAEACTSRLLQLPGQAPYRPQLPQQSHLQ